MRKTSVEQLFLQLLGLLLAALSETGSTKLAVHRRIGHPNGSLTHLSRIIHQSWRDTNIPKKYDAWKGSWKKNHPGWGYRCCLRISNQQLDAFAGECSSCNELNVAWVYSKLH